MRLSGSIDRRKSRLETALRAMTLAAIAILTAGSFAIAQTPQAKTAAREIDDPSTGRRWMLIPDPGASGGPGRLAPATKDSEGKLTCETKKDARQDAIEIVAPPRIVIRGGDRLIIEENSVVVSARLEATALRPAVVGAIFQARLKIGGKAVRVIALGAGRAAMASDVEARP